METRAVLLNGPEDLRFDGLALKAPGAGDLVVEIAHSGISTGTEKLFWSGAMPPFPGMGYPLVPGYESAGEVVEAAPETGFRPGDRVFVPGADCFDGAYGLFGGAAGHLVTQASRVTRIDAGLGPEGALLALAATARHAMAGLDKRMPDLIVGHGTLGRLLARFALAAGAPMPTVWETETSRHGGADGYPVIHPDDDPRRDYRAIYDASGNGAILNDLIGRLAKGGEVVLAGFYPTGLSFAFPPAFMKEARLRVARDRHTASSAAHASGFPGGTAGSGRPGAKGGAVGWGPVRTGRGPVGTTRQSGLGLSGRLGEAGEELLNADGEPMVVVTGDLRIDETAFTAELGGRSLDLTYREFALLKFFAMHPERVFTRDDILLAVWGDDYFGGTRTVDVHVRRLRAKLGKDLENAIHTVRNVGYRFSADSVTDTDSEDETA